MTDLDPQDRGTPGQRLAGAIRRPGTLPCIGIYDVFSASIAGQHFDALFVSGFGLAASYYGLPDIGFIAWPDVASLVQRVRTVFPGHHILVDIDDGYCDPEVACHVVSVLEASGASGIVLEDQKRPRRCGHFEGKQIMDLDEYLAKLRQVLATRRDLVVVARTDTADPHDMERRVMAFADSGADAVLIDGIPDLDIVRRLAERIAVPFPTVHAGPARCGRRRPGHLQHALPVRRAGGHRRRHGRPQEPRRHAGRKPHTRARLHPRAGGEPRPARQPVTSRSGSDGNRARRPRETAPLPLAGEGTPRDLTQRRQDEAWPPTLL
jgi:2-methylisocitrate lyase-like PEP mutase family enzyme